VDLEFSGELWFWTTSLFPKDGRYLVPVKAWVRKAERLELGDTVTVRLAVHACSAAGRSGTPVAEKRNNQMPTTLSPL
jgi:hypothetical protein